MLVTGECSLLRIQTSFPLLLQCAGISLSVGLFVYRTSTLDQKRHLWSTSTTLLLFHVALYVTLLGMMILICFHAFSELCTPVWTCLAVTLLNWVVNGASLHYSILPKNDLGVYLQVFSSLVEVIFILYIGMHVLLEAGVLYWWYWPVLLGVALWCFLCNIGFLTLLYGGKSRSSGTGSEAQRYSLLSEAHLSDIVEDDDDSGVMVSEESISLSVFFYWFTDVLRVGNSGSLVIDDLPALPPTMSAVFVRNKLQQQAEINKRQEDISSRSRWSTWMCKKRRQNDSKTHAKTSTTSTLPTLLSTTPLFCSLMANYKGIFVTQGLLKFISLCLSFSGPLLLGEMVKLIEKESDHKNVLQGILLTFILGVSFFASSMVNVQYNIRGDILKIKLKNALSLAVFSRVIDLPLHETYAKDISEAQASNMLQVDVDKVSSMVNSFHDLWSLPVQISIAFLLLYLQVDIAFVAGVIIIIVMIPTNNYIAKQIGTATERLMECKDIRVKFISECFRGIKSIKASGWESSVLVKSMAQRQDEMKYLSTRKYFDALCVFLWASMPLLVPFATFVTTVTVVKESLTVSQVFTTIALLNMLIFPMNAFPWIINGFVEAIVSFRRLSVVLIDPRRGVKPGLGGVFEGDDDGDSASTVVLGGRAFIDTYDNKEKKSSGRFYSFITNSSRLYSFIDDMLDDDAVDIDDVGMDDSLLQQLPDTVLVQVEGMTGGWHPSHDDDSFIDDSAHSKLGDALFSIGPVTITDIRRAEVIIICGSVGSGKSTLIYSLLQESYVNANAVTSYEENCVASNFSNPKSDLRTLLPPFLFGSVSLCPQKPALHTGSVKSNVLFETHFDSRRYQYIMKGCCLDEDFNLTELETADHTLRATDEDSIGQGGNKLSGGQRLRVGIARALYARSDIVLLDDPLSALDTSTAHRVMSFLHKLCHEERRVLIIATNDVYLACHCEDTASESTSDFKTSLVYLSREDGKVLKGSYSKLYSTSIEFRNMVDSESKERHQLEENKVDESPSIKNTKDNIVRDEEAKEKEYNDLEIETIERGHIRSTVLMQYIRAMGITVTVIILLSTICMQITANGMTIWLAYWTDHEDDISNTQFLQVSCAIVGLNVLFTLSRSFSFAYGGLQAARYLYHQLTKSTLNTFMHFFETQSLGRLLNRFGRDTDCIDEDLPFMLNIVLAQVFTLLGALTIIIYASPMVLVVLGIVAYGYYGLQKFYRHSSRDLRRLESTYASPVGTLLMDCLANAPVIRAQQLQRVFDDEFSKALDKAQRVSLAASIASQWLTLRLQLFGLVVIVSIAILAVINAAYGFLPMSGSRLGLSLSYAFALVGYVNGLVDSVSRAEQELISVERVNEYISLPDEFEIHDTNSRKRESIGGASIISAAKKVPMCDRLGVSSDVWPQNGMIELFDVSFSYALEHKEYEYLKHEVPLAGGYPHYEVGEIDEDSVYALSNISLSFSSGSRTVVIGRTGSGKSSLLRTILNMSTSFDGHIKVGGELLSDLPKGLLRSSFGVISQETFLFTGTIRDNIDIHGQYSDEDVLFVLNSCGILQTFCQMKASVVGQSTSSSVLFDEKFTSTNSNLDGVLDITLVDANLSQGQKQLLAVARILLTKPQFVLLDEASSSLDPLSEARMYGVLQQYLPITTTLLAVNHRYERSIIQELCPQVLELSQGKVVRYDDAVNLSSEV